jgi:hypothetical protein
MTSDMNTNSAAIAIPTRWPDSFSSARRRRDIGAAATNSRLPRRASAARVPESARIDQRLATTGKK